MELDPERLVLQAPMPSACEEPPRQPRTPLRNISNSQAQVPALHKAVLALRAGGDKVGPQVRGAHIALATSPLSQRAAGIPTRSPMAGRTPDDVRRAAKKGPASQLPLPGTLGLWKEVIDAKSGRPYYWHTGTNQVTWAKPPEAIMHQPMADVSAQLQKHFSRALVTANADDIISALASPLKQMNASAAAAAAIPSSNPSVASVCVPPDPVAEAARLKREEAKAKREAKKAEKIEQERLRLAQEQRLAQERAAQLEEQNAAVLEVISNTSSDEDESCKLDELEPLRSVPYELVALGQSLHVIASKIYMLPLELHQVEDALRARKPALEHENVLAVLHAPLLAAARGATKAAASKAATSSWMTDVKKWAFSEMGANSPFVDVGLAKQKKEGALEYKHLSYPQKLSLVSHLSAEALSRLLAAAPEDISEEFAAALRPSPLGHDKWGRAYWHGTNPAGTASAWVLRESSTQQPQRSRLSVLSSEGTPIKGDASGAADGSTTSPDGSGGMPEEHLQKQEERDAQAPERGEAGDHFYWHQQWVAVMARASRPDYFRDEAPQLELLTSDDDMLRGLVKALWQAETPYEQSLARAVAGKVLARRSAEAGEQSRKMPPRARRTALGGAAAPVRMVSA